MARAGSVRAQSLYLITDMWWRQRGDLAVTSSAHGGSSFCHPILRTPGLVGACQPRRLRRHSATKGGEMTGAVLAVTLLVALLVIDRLVDRQR
jgi:hypothetical protein